MQLLDVGSRPNDMHSVLVLLEARGVLIPDHVTRRKQRLGGMISGLLRADAGRRR